MPKNKVVEFRAAFGTYIAGDVIGEGGAGLVYAATDEQGRPVAVKVLNPERATHDRLKRFQREYQFCFQNPHPNLLKVHDFGATDWQGHETKFYVMPRYKGSLRHLMKTGIAPEDALAVFSRILDGVDAAHLKRVTHRDLKPENILANSLTDVVIADFGIARFEEETLYTMVETRGERMACFDYAAPEQHKRGVDVDQRADIFALGFILHELFTGALPFGADYPTVGAREPAYSWLDGVVRKLIQSDPAARPDGVAAVRALMRLHSDQFETQQRLSAASNAVVRSGEIDDPLAIEPPKLVDVDYRDGTLILVLDRKVHDRWVESLLSMGHYSFIQDVEPRRFRFHEDKARVRIDEHNAQGVVNCFKEWLPQATARYKRILEDENLAAERTRRQQLDRERKQLETEMRVRQSLRI